MVKVEITGYKEITKGDDTLYYLSAIALQTVEGVEGLPTYNAFISEEHLAKHGITPSDIIGRCADYYTAKRGDTFKSGITFKNYTKGDK